MLTRGAGSRGATRAQAAWATERGDAGVGVRAEQVDRCWAGGLEWGAGLEGRPRASTLPSTTTTTTTTATPKVNPPFS